MLNAFREYIADLSPRHQAILLAGVRGGADADPPAGEEGASARRDRRPTKDPLIIAALAAGATYGEAALRAGCSPKTVYQRMKTPAFRAELERVQSQTIDAIVEKLQAASISAIETINTPLGNENPRIQLSAAQQILAATPRYLDVADSQRTIGARDEVLPTQPEFDMEAAEREAMAALDEVAARRQREEARRQDRSVDEQ